MENLKNYSQFFIIIVAVNFVLSITQEGLEWLQSYLKTVMDKTESKFDNKLYKIITVILKIIKVVTYLLQKLINFSQGKFKFAGASKKK